MRHPHALFLALAAALATTDAAAQALNRVNVSAPQINCVFNTSCTVTVTDMTTPYLGNGFLQSRVFQAQPGSPAAGKWVYEYRVVMTNVTGSPVPAVTSLSVVVAAPVVAMDFNGDGNATDQVFVVTGGGLGVVGPSSAWLLGDTLHFAFSPPVSGASAAAGGQSSYFFGYVADSPPRDVEARIESNVASDVFLAVRGPEWQASGAAVPSAPGVRPRPQPQPAPRPQPRRP